MKTTAKITLLLIVLCGCCFYVSTKKRSLTKPGQSSKRDLFSRMPMEIKPVITVTGKNITLQCVTNVTLQHQDILEWSKGDKDIFIVKNRNVQENADENRFRLAASIEGLGRGNASLNISHVKHTDSGSYSCCIKNTERQCINHTVVVKNESFTTKDPGKQQKVDPSHFPTTPSPQNETNYGLRIGVPVVAVVAVVAVVVAVVAVVVAVVYLIAYLLRRKYSVPTCCRKRKRKNNDSHDHELSSLSENPSGHRERRSTEEYVV